MKKEMTKEEIRKEIERIKNLPNRINDLEFVEITNNGQFNRCVKRQSTTTNEHLLDADKREPIDNIANQIAELTEYKCNIDYNKSKITLKADKLIARVYITRNGFRISNYIDGIKKKQKATDVSELVKLVTATA